MMILVDDAGGAWPGINHAPWLGVTVADFVMPAFLFIIGVSAALVFKVYRKSLRRSTEFGMLQNPK
jgi:heparan-alpha-glucosaminide N-acetyltransferase